ncbi:DUF5797 family protein [Halocatena halophila]|uniref:DUF5797 family protein n=1 Tax=Halocatena halophila TaxID=2814576 RepID=UPI002ECFBD55
MSLSDQAKERLADIVELQPTKNKELQERWGIDSGSEIHQYLESELKEYYYRDENSLIRATPEAASIVGVETDDTAVSVPPLQATIADVLAGPDESAQSVVSVLHDVEATGDETDVDSVRTALRKLQDRGIVTTEQSTVPLFKLAIDRSELEIERIE